MLRGKAVVTLLIGLLSVSGLSASAWDKNKDKDCSCGPQKATQNCGCAPEKATPDCRCAQQAPVQRQEPCEPARCIAPRNLPAVYEQRG